MTTGLLERYVDGTPGEKDFVTLRHLADIIYPTRGLLIFREQIAEAAKLIAGFPTHSAEKFKKALCSGDIPEVKKMAKAFMSGAIKKRVPTAAAKRIFNYLCLRAPAVASRRYCLESALISYQTSYLKLHFPREWRRSAK